jgi:hypothetical protein
MKRIDRFILVVCLAVTLSATAARPAFAGRLQNGDDIPAVAKQESGPIQFLRTIFSHLIHACDGDLLPPKP